MLTKPDFEEAKFEQPNFSAVAHSVKTILLFSTKLIPPIPSPTTLHLVPPPFPAPPCPSSPHLILPSLALPSPVSTLKPLSVPATNVAPRS